jgi:hypothetical protein
VEIFPQRGGFGKGRERGRISPAILDRWMADPASYAHGPARISSPCATRRIPTILIDELVELANEVAQAKLKRRVFPPANGNGGRLIP